MKPGIGKFTPRAVMLLLFATVAVAMSTVAGAPQTPVVDPWANSSISPPPNYHGPLFHLNHDYPTQLPPTDPNPPWVRALGGKPISADNAIAYVQAVKDYITPAMRTLILDYPNWDAQKEKWYSIPWLYRIQDPIHGAYVGSGNFDHSMFPLSNMTQSNMTTYVVVYYNDVAAYTLNEFWGTTGQPNLRTDKAQFHDGAIIVKVALTTALADSWSPMEGAQTWDLYPPNFDSNQQPIPPPAMFKAAVFQFDIIVKDTKTAPKSGWVFATLTYDKRLSGDAWARMAPLGAMWGNDPTIDSATYPNAILQENVINPMAPLYATETLGYGGRLAGPNDGAVSQGNIVADRLYPRLAVSSCMSCHGVAEWPFQSNLLPGPNNPPARFPNDPLSYYYSPDSAQFRRWFQDRPGTQPQDKGTVALDYDMNIALKALPLWSKYGRPSRSAAAHTALVAQTPVGLQQLLANPERTTQTGKILH